jgi:acyl-CoA synthetase (AMP-forming)/AMP-acid ligase II/acyl carrier protein
MDLQTAFFYPSLEEGPDYSIYQETPMIPQNFNTIVDLARQRAEIHPDRNYITFLEDGDDQISNLTYSQLDQSAVHVASWLKDKGIDKGDRALIILPNSIRFTQIFYGCLYAGVLAVPLSEPAGPHQIQTYLETFVPTVKVSKPKVLITTSGLVDFITNQLPDSIKGLFSDIQIVSAGQIMKDQTNLLPLPEHSPDEVAYLQFTSGSTGTPKGIMIGHANLMANMKQAYTTCKWQEGKGTALWLPLFHDFGLAAGMIGALYMGGYVVLATPVHFILKPIRWLNMISKHKCAYSYAPPFAFEICLKKVNAEDKKDLDLSSLICSVYGAEPVHYSGVKKFNNYFSECGLKPDAIRPGFGMAETVIMFSVSDQLGSVCVDRELLETEGKVKMIDESAPQADKKYLVDLGPMMDEHEIAIKDENGNPCEDGIVGEILISGPSVCQGYFENPEATKEIFQQQIIGKDQPFLSTGDLGILWKGSLYFTGRIKDLIIIRGRNYYPQDIEYALAEIRELRAGCIVAYADSNDSGEHLCIAAEIKKEYIKDPAMFSDYILPTIDQKLTELIGNKFQIYPSKRIYLEPGVITKTSSGKIKHQANVKRFIAGTFDGLLSILPKEEEGGQTGSDIEATVIRLFKKIVEQAPILDEPFLDLGGDSIKVVEFIEALSEKYPIPGFDLMDQIDETSTLKDIIQWLESKA